MNKYERATVTAVKKANAACDILNQKRKDLQKHCSHPTEFRIETSEDCDDGYGHWWKRKGAQCTLCGKTKRYKDVERWEATSYFL